MDKSELIAAIKEYKVKHNITNTFFHVHDEYPYNNCLSEVIINDDEYPLRYGKTWFAGNTFIDEILSRVPNTIMYDEDTLVLVSIANAEKMIIKSGHALLVTYCIIGIK